METSKNKKLKAFKQVEAREIKGFLGISPGLSANGSICTGTGLCPERGGLAV